MGRPTTTPAPTTTTTTSSTTTSTTTDTTTSSSSSSTQSSLAAYVTTVKSVANGPPPGAGQPSEAPPRWKADFEVVAPPNGSGGSGPQGQWSTEPPIQANQSDQLAGGTKPPVSQLDGNRLEPLPAPPAPTGPQQVAAGGGGQAGVTSPSQNQMELDANQLDGKQLTKDYRSSGGQQQAAPASTQTTGSAPPTNELAAAPSGERKLSVAAGSGSRRAGGGASQELVWLVLAVGASLVLANHPFPFPGHPFGQRPIVRL